MRFIQRLAALTVLAALLSACGGGGSSGEAGPTSQTAAPVDNRVTLAQYAPAGPPQALPATAQLASDYRFATDPLATGATSLVVPALPLAERALLMEAAAGQQLTDLLAEPGDPRGLAAGVLQRRVYGLAEQRFRPEWLRAAERGSAHAAAPLAWSATPVTAWWDAALHTAPAGFAPSLEVADSMDARWAWPGSVERFEGVFAQDGGPRELRKMLRLSGSVWRLDTPAFSAQGLRMADGLQLVKLRPAQGSTQAFAASAQLGEALLALNQQLRAGMLGAPGLFVLGDLQETTGRAASEAQWGSTSQLSLTQLDGRGQYARAARTQHALRWDGEGLSLGGSQRLVFIGPLQASVTSGNAAGGGAVVTSVTPFFTPQPCPATDLRPELLLGLDAQHRLVWLALLPVQGTQTGVCQ